MVEWVYRKHEMLRTCEEKARGWIGKKNVPIQSFVTCVSDRGRPPMSREENMEQQSIGYVRLGWFH